MKDILDHPINNKHQAVIYLLHFTILIICMLYYSNRKSILGILILIWVNRSLDFVNLMTFDLHGTWDDLTGINAPLLPRRGETKDDRKLNVVSPFSLSLLSLSRSLALSLSRSLALSLSRSLALSLSLSVSLTFSLSLYISLPPSLSLFLCPTVSLFLCVSGFYVLRSLGLSVCVTVYLSPISLTGLGCKVLDQEGMP